VIGSWQQESVYVAVAAVEALVLNLIWKTPGPSASAVRHYLKVQLAIFLCLFTASLFADCRLYVPIYLAASLANLIVELGVLAGIFTDLNAGVRVFGSIWLWFALCLAATIAIAAMLVLEPPSDAHISLRLYLVLDQIGTLLRNAALFAIVAYGWLCGTSWPPRISLIWLGMAIYSLIDFACQRFQLIQSFTETVQYGPTAGSIVMLTLWAAALRTTSPLPLAATPEKQTT